MNLGRAVLGAALFFYMGLLPADVSAQDITLTAQSDGFELRGQFVGFDGRYYRVQTEFGVLTVDSAAVVCAGQGCVDRADQTATVAIAGSRTMGEFLLPSMIEAYAFEIGATFERVEAPEKTVYRLIDRLTQDQRVEFSIRSRSSSEGFADLSLNKADLVMSIREIDTSEAHVLKSKGLGNLQSVGQSQIIGLDALVVTDFDGSIVPVDGENRLFNLTDNAQDLTDVLKRRFDLTDDHIGSRDGAIVFTPYSQAGFLETKPLRGDCGFVIAPTRLSIKSEDYPLTVPLLLYWPNIRQSDVVSDFLNFIRSDAGQLVVRRSGFVELTPEEIPVSQQGARFAASIPRAGTHVPLSDLQAMVDVIGPATRLSMSFRLASGALGLDAQSKSNVQQMAQEIRSGRYDGKTLILAGFSDGQGDSEINKSLSLKRAQNVFSDLKRALGTADLERVQVETYGFGEALPMGCDDSTWGRNMNRRVEVWLK